MIDVGTIAGTSNAVAPGAAAYAGAQGPVAVDEGAFRESLKASVVAATNARSVAAEVPPGARLVQTQSAVSAQAAVGVRTAAATTTPVALQGSVVEGSAAVLSAPGANLLSEGAAGVVTPPDASVAGTASSAGAGLVSLAVVKPVEGSGTAAALLGAKELKDGAGAAGKKTSGKSTEQQVAPGVVEAAAGNAAAGVGLAAAVPVALAVVGLPVPVASAGAEAGQMQAAAAGVNGSAKVGSSHGVVKAVGRDAKKVDGQAAVVGKAEAGSSAGAGVVSAVAGSASHVVVKDAGAVSSGLTVAGFGTATPAGVAASHVGLAGAAGSKVAANVDAVSTAGGQGGGAAGPEVKTLAATPNLLEVGIDGGTHGWLRVRAELGQTGEVTASMVASSAGQADALRRELPAMSTYLAGESVGVSSLAVNAAGAAAGAQDAAMNPGAGAQGNGADGRAAQGSLTGETGSGPQGALEGVAGLEFSGAELPAAVYANGSGSWLSVRV